MAWGWRIYCRCFVWMSVGWYKHEAGSISILSNPTLLSTTSCCYVSSSFLYYMHQKCLSMASSPSIINDRDWVSWGYCIVQFCFLYGIKFLLTVVATIVTTLWLVRGRLVIFYTCTNFFLQSCINFFLVQIHNNLVWVSGLLIFI